ncbi:TetR/AcrR family transcriptional regulator [Chitinophaga agrisoli]|uniref:TetR/AcrR family transcriptional regulator n=1 Tax=Chitinophaga agrisoli TaxID=2607653 RepID=A0A5B2VLX3_9BACT|nr:TetR/AcrR family transcriptional regulator [Chitinophaga agrisoli]KAA2239322.1 TetR/AcrR family transcriptional regulator [Chitinophaga agrisoli]
MGRPQAFNEDEVIDKALDVFWEKGFLGASTRDLIDATGISNGSFFNSFGDKKQLYLKCLQKYNKVYVSSLEHLLGSNLPFKEKIRKTLQAASRKTVGKDLYSGCFLYNTLIDKGVDDVNITETSREINARMDQAFINAVELAKKNKELLPAVKVTPFAQYLSNVAGGIRILVLHNPSEAHINNVIQQTLAFLPLREEE